MSRLLPLVAGPVAFGCFYLLGAFMAASFNIAEWQAEMRVLTGIFGFACAVVATGLSLRQVQP